MADFEFVQGNRRPVFAVQFKGRDDETIINLTGCTVSFTFKHQRAQTAKVNAQACSITDAALGKAEYQWGTNDLDVDGLYDAEFRITFGDGRIQSVLIEGVVVKPKLA